MITLSIKVETTGTQVLVQLDKRLSDRTSLHKLLATRLAEELQEHFLEKNKKPNRLGGERTNFWQGLAQNTAVSEVTAEGATVTVADKRFNIHVYGGKVVPKEKKVLTIPLVAAAHGRRVAQYEEQAGVKLFGIKGKNALFQKVGNTVRAVYALVKSAKINKDPEALPSVARLTAAFTEEVEDYFTLTESQA